ncbi:MAG: hypothetical protein AB7I37_09005 [Pirellulales bacterium]
MAVVIVLIDMILGVMVGLAVAIVVVVVSIIAVMMAMFMVAMFVVTVFMVTVFMVTVFMVTVFMVTMFVAVIVVILDRLCRFGIRRSRDASPQPQQHPQAQDRGKAPLKAQHTTTPGLIRKGR